MYMFVCYSVCIVCVLCESLCVRFAKNAFSEFVYFTQEEILYKKYL